MEIGWFVWLVFLCVFVIFIIFGKVLIWEVVLGWSCELNV